MVLSAPGWFGKIASQGDFASRRLPADWVQSCDQWLSACVASSRQQLGEQWLQAYLSAPLWRFAWAPGVVDSQWWFGVLMSSCDSVGRYFPLLIVQPRPHAPQDRIGLDHLDLWWQQVAQAAMGTLADGVDLQAFETRLAAAPPWPGAVPRLGASALQAGAWGRWRQSVPAQASLAELAHHLASEQLGSRMAGHSWWWPLWPQGGPASCTIVAGLPPPEAYGEMLRGSW